MNTPPSYAVSVRGKWEGFLDRLPMWTRLWNCNQVKVVSNGCCIGGVLGHIIRSCLLQPSIINHQPNQIFEEQFNGNFVANWTLVIERMDECLTTSNNYVQ
jgi:hypothetical protein